MKSLTILQAERQELLKTLKQLRITYKQIGVDLQPQIQLKIYEVEQSIIEKDKDIDSHRKNTREEEVEEKLVEKEEVSEQNKWNAFKNALKIYDETNMCFHKNSQPRYFYKKSYQDFDKKTGLPRPVTTELLMFSPQSLEQNWPELESKIAQQFLKYIVHGQTINIVNSETKQLETFKFDRRVYTKLGNTKHTPDPETYNMIDTSKIMRPTGEEDECPIIIYQLLLALSGNVVKEDGTLTKPENLSWLEKWLYGVLVADIGNNMLSMPVFFGSGKVGKNAMFDKIFPRIFGTELCFTGLWDNLDGNFTGFKLGKVFIYLDEIPPRDDWNKLKNLTGSPVELVKMKYGPEFVIENTVALAIGTNQVIFPLPLEDGKQMTRVSPIQTDMRSTFAENVAKFFEETQEGMMAHYLEAQGIDVTNFKDDLYELGDKFLKMNEKEWCGEEEVQKFLNYLHKKYKTDKYTLEPLRGQDWEEILKTKPNPLNQVVEYITIDRNADAVTINELYEIYKVMTGDKQNNLFIKNLNNFSAQIWPLIKAAGYERKSRAWIEVEPTAGAGMKQFLQTGTRTTIKSQTTVFHKPNVIVGTLKQNVDQYIVEERVGRTEIRRLIY